MAHLFVQVIDAGPIGVGFALVDVLIVHTDNTTGRYGFRDGLALGDSNVIIGPLTRFTAAAFAVRPLAPVRVTTKRRLHTLNAMFVRSAMHEVACHPDDERELSRVCRRVAQLPPDVMVRV